MSGKRQNHELRLDFDAPARSEAPSADGGGTETLATSRDTESPATADTLMEEVLKGENLKEALKRVKANKGSAGVDGIPYGISLAT